MNVDERVWRSARLGAALALAATVALPTAGLAGGTVKGKVSYTGAPPAPTKLAMDADPVCAAAHTTPVMSQELVVNDGGLANVFIYIDGAPAKPAPTTPAVIDQKGCQYTPHVLGVQVGQPLQILNSDQTLHNIHGMPKKNPSFNFAMPKFVKKKDTKFDSAEVMVAVKCDVHPWMNSYVGVLEHPYFAVSGADGTFSIADVPPGEYTVKAWQEKLGEKDAKVKVDEGGTATVDFSYAG
jgi:plastocyanin